LVPVGSHPVSKRPISLLEAAGRSSPSRPTKLTAKRLKLLHNALAVRDEAAAPVIKRAHKPGKADAEPLQGRFKEVLYGKTHVVEYEPDTELRDTEQVSLLEEGGIKAFIRREVLPHAPDAWIDESKTQVGYEISFTRYFYKPQPLRTLDEIKADILALERETEGLLHEITGKAAA
jgi:type I restriction enzyme M protein